MTTEPADMRGSLTTVGAVRKFALAGNAIFTILSRKTSGRLTFRVRKGEKREGDQSEPPWFAAVLTGPDNGKDYTFLGTIRRDGTRFRYFRSPKSKVGPDAPSAKGIAWLVTMLDREEDAATLNVSEVWHEGRCGRCGRKLTVPSSIAAGLGPDCAERED